MGDPAPHLQLLPGPLFGSTPGGLLRRPSWFFGDLGDIHRGRGSHVCGSCRKLRGRDRVKGRGETRLGVNPTPPWWLMRPALGRLSCSQEHCWGRGARVGSRPQPRCSLLRSDQTGLCLVCDVSIGTAHQAQGGVFPFLGHSPPGLGVSWRQVCVCHTRGQRCPVTAVTVLGESGGYLMEGGRHGVERGPWGCPSAQTQNSSCGDGRVRASKTSFCSCLGTNVH